MSAINGALGEVVGYDRLKNDENFKKAHEQYIEILSLVEKPVFMCDVGFFVIWTNSAAIRKHPNLSCREGIRELTEEFGHKKLLGHLRDSGETELSNILLPEDINILFRPIRTNGEISAVIAILEPVHGFCLKGSNTDVLSRTAAPVHRSRTPDTLASGIRTAISGSFDVLDILISRSDVLGMAWTTLLAQQIAMRNYQALRVVSNFTCYTRLQSRQLQLSPATCNLSAWVEVIAVSLESRAKQAGVSMIVNPTREENYVLLDMPSFETAFYNVLHNALYYTRPANKVTLTMRESRQNVVLLIQDWGLGIPPDMLEDGRVFEPHFSYTHGMPVVASGLGLTLAKKIIEAHGGEIHITSELGEGTTVEISLPTQTPADALTFEQEPISYSPPQDRFSAMDVGLAGLEDKPRW